jgi:hypothetical protein
MNLKPRGPNPTCAKCGESEDVAWHESLDANFCHQCSPWGDLTEAERVIECYGAPDGSGARSRVDQIERSLPEEVAKSEAAASSRVRARARATVENLRKELAIQKRRLPRELRAYEAAIGEALKELAELDDPTDRERKKRHLRELCLGGLRHDLSPAVLEKLIAAVGELRETDW